MRTRTTRIINTDDGIPAAIALLLNNQAALVAQHTRFLNEMAEMRKEFEEVKRRLSAIEATLARHEAILERLADAIREKIGFK